MAAYYRDPWLEPNYVEGGGVGQTGGSSGLLTRNPFVPEDFGATHAILAAPQVPPGPLVGEQGFAQGGTAGQTGEWDAWRQNARQVSQNQNSMPFVFDPQRTQGLLNQKGLDGQWTQKETNEDLIKALYPFSNIYHESEIPELTNQGNTSAGTFYADPADNPKNWEDDNYYGKGWAFEG